MNRQQKKMYLHGYQSAKVRLRNLQDEYETVFTEATKIVPTLSGMPSSNVKDDKLLKYTIKLAEIQEKIDRTKKQIERVDLELAKLKPYHRRLITQIDIKRVPAQVVAKRQGITEHAIRTRRNRIIDKMFLQELM